MSHVATIRAADLPFVYALEKSRRMGILSGGKDHAQFCALSSGGAMISLDCHQRAPRPHHIADAKRWGKSPVHVSPMQRGHITSLIERTRLSEGLPAVRSIWGTGLRALQAEPRHILSRGAAS